MYRTLHVVSAKAGFSWRGGGWPNNLLTVYWQVRYTLSPWRNLHATLHGQFVVHTLAVKFQLYSVSMLTFFFSRLWDFVQISGQSGRYRRPQLACWSVLHLGTDSPLCSLAFGAYRGRSSSLSLFVLSSSLTHSPTLSPTLTLSLASLAVLQSALSRLICCWLCLPVTVSLPHSLCSRYHTHTVLHTIESRYVIEPITN